VESILQQVGAPAVLNHADNVRIPNASGDTAFAPHVKRFSAVRDKRWTINDYHRTAVSPNIPRVAHVRNHAFDKSTIAIRRATLFHQNLPAGAVKPSSPRFARPAETTRKIHRLGINKKI